MHLTQQAVEHLEKHGPCSAFEIGRAIGCEAGAVIAALDRAPNATRCAPPKGKDSCWWWRLDHQPAPNGLTAAAPAAQAAPAKPVIAAMPPKQTAEELLEPSVAACVPIGAWGIGADVIAQRMRVGVADVVGAAKCSKRMETVDRHGCLFIRFRESLR